MAPKRNVSSSNTSTPPKSSTPTPGAVSSPAKGSSSSSTAASSTSASSLSSKSSAQDIAVHVWNQYVKNTPLRIKLLDVFMGFLVVVGGIQFLYCVVAGNYPFNAFLSGFCAAVGQFVLTASLRMQTSSTTTAATTTSSKEKSTGDELQDLGLEGKGYSQERAFADFVFGSLILHVFCVNFIN